MIRVKTTSPVRHPQFKSDRTGLSEGLQLMFGILTYRFKSIPNEETLLLLAIHFEILRVMIPGMVNVPVEPS